jgi:vanillate O-demethylase monooxygenase subunit
MMIGNVNMTAGAAEYPINQWYVIALSQEVGSELLRRECLGEPVVLYRTGGGKPVALFDRCPHRGMPLSQGRLIGDHLQCGYHGIEFDADGKCTKVPSGGAAPAAMCVRQYPLVERWQWLWIWMGDPQLADPVLIPDHNELKLTAEGWHSDAGLHLELKANYLLPFENLVDATHITFLHHGLIDTGNVASVPMRTETTGNIVRTTREFTNEPLPEMLRHAFGLRGERVNRTLELTSFVPNLCLIRNSFVELDIPDPKAQTNQLIVAVTPANRRQTHQFGVFANSFPGKHPNRWNDLRNLLSEDIVAIEQIQATFDQCGESRCPEISVRADKPGIETRRMIAAMIEQERNTRAAA